MPPQGREPAGERTRAPKRSTVRRRRQKTQRSSARGREDRCRSIAPRSSCVLYDKFPRFVTAGGPPRPLTRWRRLRSRGVTREPGRRCWLLLHDVDDWEARIGVEAGGGEERGAEVSVEE